ncbi:MAG: dimethyl sulfoxide reductase anchor subunit family protein [Paracoccaceae bacterium]
MNPAPSVIVFSVLSGMGFGLLAFLGAGFVVPAGWAAFLWWGLGYALALAGLLAATFHLGNPKNAIKAFSQWRSSWLSREAWAAVATLVILSPVALSDWLGLGWPREIGVVGAALALFTVFTTAMIYAQIRAVPRWHYWTTPALFLTFALTGGMILSGQVAAPLACLALGALLIVAFMLGDGRFAAAGVTLGSATGLGAVGRPSVFEQPHTGGNYLMREMIYVVGRKHALRLRAIAVICAGVVPAIVLMLSSGILAIVIAAILHLIGAFAARWLFFAEAEHVVGLYYGQR